MSLWNYFRFDIIWLLGYVYCYIYIHILTDLQLQILNPYVEYSLLECDVVWLLNDKKFTKIVLNVKLQSSLSHSLHVKANAL
jgi:hypothetical protein